MTFLDYLLGRNKPAAQAEPVHKPLVEELADLKATAVERAAARQAAIDEAKLQYEKDERKRGLADAEDQFKTYRERIVRQVSYDAEKNSYEISIAFYQTSKELDPYAEGMARGLRDQFSFEGVNAELKWEELPPGDGSYYQFDQTRYSANLVVTW